MECVLCAGAVGGTVGCWTGSGGGGGGGGGRAGGEGRGAEVGAGWRGCQWLLNQGIAVAEESVAVGMFEKGEMWA